MDQLNADLKHKIGAVNQDGADYIYNRINDIMASNYNLETLGSGAYEKIYVAKLKELISKDGFISYHHVSENSEKEQITEQIKKCTDYQAIKYLLHEKGIPEGLAKNLLACKSPDTFHPQEVKKNGLKYNYERADQVIELIEKNRISEKMAIADLHTEQFKEKLKTMGLAETSVDYKEMVLRFSSIMRTDAKIEKFNDYDEVYRLCTQEAILQRGGYVFRHEVDKIENSTDFITALIMEKRQLKDVDVERALKNNSPSEIYGGSDISTGELVKLACYCAGSKVPFDIYKYPAIAEQPICDREKFKTGRLDNKQSIFKQLAKSAIDWAQDDKTVQKEAPKDSRRLGVKDKDQGLTM